MRSVKCNAKTSKGAFCRRNRLNGPYCKQHSIRADYTLSEDEISTFWSNQIPVEMWQEIVSHIEDLPILAKFYQTCKNFHRMFANEEWLKRVPYFALLKDNRNEYVATNNTLPEYTIKQTNEGDIRIYNQGIRLPFSAKNSPNSKGNFFVNRIESFNVLSKNRLSLSCQKHVLHEKIMNLAKNYTIIEIMGKVALLASHPVFMCLIDAPDDEWIPILTEVATQLRTVHQGITLAKVGTKLFVNLEGDRPQITYY